MTAYTPGPWKAVALTNHEFTNYELQDCAGKAVGTVYVRSDGATARLAQLMAAAPELLEALEWTLPWLELIPLPREDTFATDLEMARAAAAKAKGA